MPLERFIFNYADKVSSDRSDIINSTSLSIAYDCKVAYNTKWQCKPMNKAMPIRLDFIVKKQFLFPYSNKQFNGNTQIIDDFDRVQPDGVKTQLSLDPDSLLAHGLKPDYK